jgi:hypothetical protein
MSETVCLSASVPGILHFIYLFCYSFSVRTQVCSLFSAVSLLCGCVKYLMYITQFFLEGVG